MRIFPSPYAYFLPQTGKLRALASCRNPFAAAAAVTSHEQSRKTKDASDKSNCRVTRKPNTARPSQNPIKREPQQKRTAKLSAFKFQI